MPATKLPDAETWNLVAFIHALIGPASETKPPGDTEAGERIFQSSKTGCSNCHSIRGRGGHIGPDLTNIGNRPLAVIKDAVLKRSRDLYLLGEEGVTVTLDDGQVIQDWLTLTLAPGEQWQQLVTLPAGHTSGQVEAVLFRADSPHTVYRRVVLKPAT